MTIEATYQLANIISLCTLCSGLGLIAGFGWGREFQRQTLAQAAARAEAARIERFRVIFRDGVTQKEAAPVGRK